MLPIILDVEAFEGVKKIADKSAKDFERVFGAKPEIKSSLEGVKGDAILFATLGQSSILDELNLKDVAFLENKTECYIVRKVNNPNENVDNLLVVVGSDKRGTIYGIFDISEQIGVSPLVYWGDVNPKKKDSFKLADIEEKTSKEPSVKYRGFFINDEWPCFGNWTFSHFNGFTAEMYDHVFELVLRLKGNCLWPAMWSSSFALDGPGNLNEELADCYGVIMNYSHHEPCLRASEEWDIYKGEDTEYGTEWNYSTNSQGLLNYWRDGLKRSGKYENIVTMGMRGERDSKMLGVNTLQDSIDFWKEIITKQNELIKEYADSKDYIHPRMVAIYKEVEDYFFGDDTTEGLNGMPILDDMLLMFCDDNFGYMRRLPQGKLRNHKGGLGMYHHFDYHGDPISYEWINSTQLSKTWEQMTSAYEHGIKDMWMVNVGDLKGNEVPLYYFMSLAYDYDKWGIDNLNSGSEFMEFFAKESFENKEVGKVYSKAIDLIARRKPEALSPYTYDLSNGEAFAILQAAIDTLEELDRVKKNIPDYALDGFYSMVEYPVTVGLNHIKLHIYSRLNEHFAKQGKTVANKYMNLVTEAYAKEASIIKSFAEFKDGKWSGMELAAHTGFTKWNEDGARKALRYMVEPLAKSHLLVSIKGQDKVAMKNYGTFDKLVIDDFAYLDADRAFVEVAVDGIESVDCQVKCEAKELTFNWTNKSIADQEILEISLNKDEKITEDKIISVYVTDCDTTVELEIPVKANPTAYKNGVAILASDFARINENDGFTFKAIADYGKHNSGVKMFPINETPDSSARPSLVYKQEFLDSFSGQVELHVAPTSPLNENNKLQLGLSVNGAAPIMVELVGKDYKAGAPGCIEWAKGVLDNERVVKVPVELIKGENTFEIIGVDAGVVLEKLIIKTSR